LAAEIFERFAYLLSLSMTMSSRFYLCYASQDPFFNMLVNICQKPINIDRCIVKFGCRHQPSYLPRSTAFKIRLALRLGEK